MVPPLTFDPLPGLFPSAVQVYIGCATPNVTDVATILWGLALPIRYTSDGTDLAIRYTSDGTDPAVHGQPLQGPIMVFPGHNVSVLARGFLPGFVPSPVAAATYKAIPEA
ncbi:hypothetical protein T484DRAFT_1865879 [Baffinella frigidus]|nr:hypothetical protein T484DRAFT_1865879 [Cryptophyta sp. CCMP2293]